MDKNDAFVVSDKPVRETRETSAKSSIINGITRYYIDSPDISNGEDDESIPYINEQEYGKYFQMYQFLRKWQFGINAFFIIINVQNPRFTESTRKMMTIMNDFFNNPEIWTHTGIIFTRCFSNCFEPEIGLIIGQKIYNTIKNLPGCSKIEPQLPIFFVDAKEWQTNPNTQHEYQRMFNFAYEMDPIYSNNISFKSKIEYEELITEICNKKITEYAFWHNNDYYMVQIELQKTTAKMAMKEKEYDCIKEKFEKLKKEKEGLQVTNDQMMKKLKEFTLKEKDYKNKIELIEEQLENKSKEIKNLQEINGQMKIKEEDYKKQIKELTNETKKPKDINHFNIYAVPEIETFHIIKKIGKGGSSEVFEVTHGENYALKIIDIDGVSSFINRQRFIREYEVLNELNHPNIIKVFGICNGDETHPPSIVLELCPSNLSCQIKSLNDIERISIIIEICSAMKEVHKAGIIHRDLKLENILLDKNNHVKLSDFSICTFFDNNGSMNHTQMIGTLKFMAPEIILEQTDYNEKIDVYSFGVVFFLILTKGEFPKINIVDVGKGKKAEIPKFITEFSRDLINLCWSFDPKERPSFDDIYRNLTENKNKIL